MQGTGALAAMEKALTVNWSHLNHQSPAIWVEIPVEK
jgi:hypothetical protein